MPVLSGAFICASTLKGFPKDRVYKDFFTGLLYQYDLNKGELNSKGKGPLRGIRAPQEKERVAKRAVREALRALPACDVSLSVYMNGIYRFCLSKWNFRFVWISPLLASVSQGSIKFREVQRRYCYW